MRRAQVQAHQVDDGQLPQTAPQFVLVGPAPGRDGGIGRDIHDEPHHLDRSPRSNPSMAADDPGVHQPSAEKMVQPGRGRPGGVGLDGHNERYEPTAAADTGGRRGAAGKGLPSWPPAPDRHRPDPDDCGGSDGVDIDDLHGEPTTAVKGGDLHIADQPAVI